MIRFGLLLIACSFGGILLLPAVVSQSQPISQKARDLHFRSLIVDTHDDTTQRLLDPRFDLSVQHTDGSIDIPRMREGGLDAIFFSIYIPGTVTGPPAVQRALEQIEAVRRQVTLYPNDLALATTAAEVRNAFAAHKIAVLMGGPGSERDVSLATGRGVVKALRSLGSNVTEIDIKGTDFALPAGIEHPPHRFGDQLVVSRERRPEIVLDQRVQIAPALLRLEHGYAVPTCTAIAPAPRRM